MDETESTEISQISWDSENVTLTKDNVNAIFKTINTLVGRVNALQNAVDTAENYAEAAAGSATNAATSATNAATSEDNAEAYATGETNSAKSYASSAAGSVVAAAAFKDQAATSATSATDSKESAEAFMNNAYSFATSAKKSAENAAESLAQFQQVIHTAGDVITYPTTQAVRAFGYTISAQSIRVQTPWIVDETVKSITITGLTADSYPKANFRVSYGTNTYYYITPTSATSQNVLLTTDETTSPYVSWSVKDFAYNTANGVALNITFSTGLVYYSTKVSTTSIVANIPIVIDLWNGFIVTFEGAEESAQTEGGAAN